MESGRKRQQERTTKPLISNYKDPCGTTEVEL